MPENTTATTGNTASQRYFTIWRWHFYAGIFVAPLLMVLAITGLGMLLFANIEGRDGEYVYVAPAAQVQPLSQQAQAALNKVDAQNGKVIQYFVPRAPDMAAIFRVDNAEGKATMVAVNPYTAEVVKTYPRRQGIYHLMDEIHGDMLMGTAGDYLLETAAALTVLMVLTGWYLWWTTRRRSVVKMLLPGRTKEGRSLWRSLHGMFGTYVSLMLLVFCISGMAWAGIWGGKMVQSWSQFPAGKWGVAPNPESTVPTHGDLNDGKTKDIPWALELTPMPVSGTTLGEDGIKAGEPLTFETIDRFAREKGFTDRYQIYFPKGEKGVWTINLDSMSYDSPSPTADRTMHIDQYSGKVLADIKFDDYNWFGKFMAVSIAFHIGTMGVWSIALNVVFCLLVIFLCISGYVMWWKRRPSDSALCPPAQGKTLPQWTAAAVGLFAVALIFPTAAAAIVLVALLDWLLVSRIGFFKKLLK